ncbi:MAG TPA: glycosyltransferase family 4 protein [Nitrospiria bacterium]|nr:glycosyltransferase family 4 protein [Nitrospiria bacterium]
MALKIAILTKNFNFRNGSSRTVHETAIRFAREGHDVHVFCNQAPKNYSSGPVIHHVPMLRLGSWAKMISFDRGCRRLLRNQGFDIVHGQGNTIEQDILTVHVFRKANRQARGLSTSALYPHCYLENKQFSYPRLRTVIALSGRVRQDLHRTYGIPLERIRVIPNGVDTIRFHPELRGRIREQIRSRWEMEKEDIAVLFVASGNYQNRGLPNLMSAFRSLDGGRFRLMVIGGDRRGRFQEMAQELGIEDRVRFLPFSDRIEEVYAGGDVLAFPSYFDTFGNVPLEAMASGLPVVVSAACGVSEWIHNGKNGILLDDPADSDSLEKIVSRLADQDLRDEIGRAARETVLTMGWDRIAAKVFEVYSDFVSGKAA